MRKIILSICCILAFSFTSVSIVHADTLSSVTNATNFLRSKQDSSGKITGNGGESQWGAIAFTASGIDPSTVKNASSGALLKDYLTADQPASGSAATEWERRILVITAIGSDPSNFGGVNYVAGLQAFANNHQIGDTTLLNDDIFGLLALVASGTSVDQTIRQDTLNFLISHQDSDGGFTWSTDSTCAWCGSDSNDTAAVIQALVGAKKSGMSEANLDTTIAKAKTYLLTTQKSDGGFGYDAFSDSDGSSTSWSLMALNSLDLETSPEAQKAMSWLENNQSSDGGFYWMSGYPSDTATTSHAVIALDGKGWLLQMFPQAATSASPSSVPTPSPSPSLVPSPSATPSPASSSESTPSPSPTPNPTPSPVPSLEITPQPRSNIVKSRPKATSQPEVLGLMTTAEPSVSPEPTSTPKPLVSPSKSIITSPQSNIKNIVITLAVMSGICVLIVALKIYEKRKGK